MAGRGDGGAANSSAEIASGKRELASVAASFAMGRQKQKRSDEAERCRLEGAD